MVSKLESMHDCCANRCKAALETMTFPAIRSEQKHLERHLCLTIHREGTSAQGAKGALSALSSTEH